MIEPTPLRGSNGIAFGPDGRLHVAEYLSGRISAVDVTTGATEVVVAAGGPLQAPDDLAFDSDGTMYVTDLAPGRVWRRTPAGGFNLVAEGIRNPNGIACVGTRVFVNEMVPGGRLLEVGAGELVADDVPQTVAVRFDRHGVLVVLSLDEAGTVRRIDGGRRTTIVTGIPGLDNAAFDTGNRMFVSSFSAGGITEVLPDGSLREVVARGLAGPYGIAVDAAGTLRVADHYRLDGAFLPFAHALAADGGELHFTSQYGQAATFDVASRSTRIRAENLDQPQGVVVRADGALVIAEAGTGRVLAVVEACSPLRVLAGGLPIAPARDTQPALFAEGLPGVPRQVTALAAGPDGSLYLAGTADGSVLRLPYPW